MPHNAVSDQGLHGWFSLEQGNSGEYALKRSYKQLMFCHTNFRHGFCNLLLIILRNFIQKEANLMLYQIRLNVAHQIEKSHISSKIFHASFYSYMYEFDHACPA